MQGKNFEIRERVQRWTPPDTPEDSRCSTEDFRDVIVRLATLDAGYLAHARNQQDVAFNAWFFDLSTIPKPWLLRAIGSYYAARRKPNFSRPDPLHLSQLIRELARRDHDREQNERQRLLEEIQRKNPELLKLDFEWSKETLREHLIKLPPLRRTVPWQKWHEKHGIQNVDAIEMEERTI